MFILDELICHNNIMVGYIGLKAPEERNDANARHAIDVFDRMAVQCRVRGKFRARHCGRMVSPRLVGAVVRPDRAVTPHSCRPKAPVPPSGMATGRVVKTRPAGMASVRPGAGCENRLPAITAEGVPHLYGKPEFPRREMTETAGIAEDGIKRRALTKFSARLGAPRR